MDRFSRDLDRHITGNYGEDFFKYECKSCFEKEAEFLACKGGHAFIVCGCCRPKLAIDGYKFFPLYPPEGEGQEYED